MGPLQGKTAILGAARLDRPGAFRRLLTERGDVQLLIETLRLNNEGGEFLRVRRVEVQDIVTGFAQQAVGIDDNTDV